MKGRFRWYTLNLSGISIRRLADAMAKLEYTRRRTSGFRLSEVRRDTIAGRFIEKLEWDDTVEDPAEGQIQIHRVEMKQLSFRISIASPELELFEPPRSARTFLETIDECAGEALTIAELSIEPMAWLAELEREAGRLTVLALTIGGVTLSARVSAAMRIGGTEDVRQHLAQVTGGRRYQVERVVVQLRAPYSARCELLRGGRVAVIDADERTVDLLRTTLRAALAHNAKAASQ